MDTSPFSRAATCPSLAAAVMTPSKRSTVGLLTFVIVALLSLIPFRVQAQRPDSSAMKVKIPLLSGWQFREVTKDRWYPAQVPGCVHTDLLSNHLIEDPFYRDNEQKLQWIGKTDWEYQTSFEVTPDLLNHQHLELVFEGLDTYARV